MLLLMKPLKFIPHGAPPELTILLICRNSLFSDLFSRINVLPLNTTSLISQFYSYSEMETDIKIIKYARLASIIIFLVSLTQKCYCTTTNCSDSIMVLLLGWAAIFSTGAGLSWFANPLLLAAWIMIKKNLKAAMFLSVFSFLLALFFLVFDQIVDNEGGIAHPIISHNAGYWLWVFSHLVMLTSTFVLMYRYNVRNKTVTRPRYF